MSQPSNQHLLEVRDLRISFFTDEGEVARGGQHQLYDESRRNAGGSWARAAAARA